MKIDKKLIKEMVDSLKEFSLTELEYQDGQKKIKVCHKDHEFAKQKIDFNFPFGWVNHTLIGSKEFRANLF